MALVVCELINVAAVFDALFENVTRGEGWPRRISESIESDPLYSKAEA